MADAIVVVLLAAFAVFLIGLLYILLRTRGEEEEYLNYMIGDNLMPQYSGGYSSFVLVDFHKGPLRNEYIVSPRDVNWLKRLKENPDFQIPTYSIFANSWQVFPFPETTWSGDRNRIIICPPSAEDLPREFRETPIGRAIAKELTLRKSEENVIEVMRMEKELEDEMLRRTKGKDRVREFLIQNSQLNKQLVKDVLDTKDASKKSSINLPPFGTSQQNY